MPYVAMVEAEFSRKLLKGSEAEFHIDLDETYLLKADKAATANYYSAMVNNGILTRNEARRELGYSDVEGGDKLIMAFTKIDDNTIGNSDTDEK